MDSTALNLPNDTAIVIAHHHPEGRVARHLIEFIEYVRRCVTSTVILVSTGISDEYKILLEGFCTVIRRENVGYDFWSYKVGLEALPADRPWKRWVILNSSIVISNPALLVHELFSRPIGFGMIGLTKSMEIAPHVQSYCVVFEGEDFLGSTIMKNWWKQMQPISDRERVIRSYEIGMTQYFAKNKIPVNALYHPNSREKLMAIMRWMVEKREPLVLPAHQDSYVIRLSDGDRINPTHWMWDVVFARFWVVKIDFLKRNTFSKQLYSLVESLPDPMKSHVRDLIEDALI